jgi:hypothetical protein
MQTSYTVDYFLDKFSKIPESRWTTHVFSEKKFLSTRKCCAQGHCLPLFVLKETEKKKSINIRIDKYSIHDFSEAFALIALFGQRNLTTSQRIANINNGSDIHYNQPTPKQRILAALRDIKKLQEPEAKPEVKERIKYVSVPTSITEQTKEIILS